LYTHIRQMLYTHIRRMAEKCCTDVCYASGVATMNAQTAHQEAANEGTSGCGAASSAPRSGRGGRRCEACHPDHVGVWCNSSTAVSNTVRCPCNSGGPCQRNFTNRIVQHISDRLARRSPAGAAAPAAPASGSSQRRRLRSRSCPSPSLNPDRIAQQTERRRAKPEARGANPRAVARSL
jgi:hypothetical protein